MKRALLLALTTTLLFSKSAKSPVYNPDNLYAKVAIVTDLNKDDDIVTVTDSSGYMWEFSGCEDWQIYDYCSMVMYDNNTSLIFDDIIIDIKYEIIPK